MKDIKNITLYTIGIILSGFFAACTSYDAELPTYPVSIQLTMDGLEQKDSFEVTLTNNLGNKVMAFTDNDGIAHFNIPAGIYQGSTSKIVEKFNSRIVYNASVSDLVVGENQQASNTNITLPVIRTTTNILVIKEIYTGGCQKNDNSGAFNYDKCIILYNNSPSEVSLDNVAIGMIEPYNAEASTHSFISDGKLDYEEEDWIPALNGIWYFQNGHKIQPYSELVINTSGAIDNTIVYANSINYANKDYFCFYDTESSGPDGKTYSSKLYYPAPSSLIPVSQYLKAVKYGNGTAWMMSNTSPAIIVFRTEGCTPKDFASNNENITYPSGRQGNNAYSCLKVKRSWVIDAVETFNALKQGDNKKRITPDLDNGAVMHTSQQGHSLIRKVDKVVDGHNIYLDTNNSTNDFYEASQCSLKK